ncbi:MAG: hypothetical protein AAGI91_10570 [Bacteroidota bacterium]
MTSHSTSKTIVPAGLRAFLAGLIDYAGLFPPARLPLEVAVPNFAAYRQSEDAWMLGRFICPASRLGDLSAYAEHFTPEAPFPVSVLGSGGADAESFRRAFRDDMQAVKAFEDRHGDSVRSDLLETRLPEAVTEAGSDAVAGVLLRASEAAAEAGVAFERMHFEAGFTGEWRETIGGAVTALARHNAGGGPPVGFKVRCGGVTPDAFPTPEQVAFVLAACRDAGVPFKATAGLHHPVRHLDRTVGAMMHGFLNVFGAGVLAHALDLTEASLRQLLRGESIKAFAFDETGFAFQDLSISTRQVARAREVFAMSYGSCSFDEPREDLRAAGLL